jgi:hypothetical protein
MTPKRTRKKGAPAWKVGRRAYIGLDTWSGRHLVNGFCAVYEVTELNESTGEVRTRIERGPAKYLHNMTMEVTVMAEAFGILHTALRRHAEAK